MESDEGSFFFGFGVAEMAARAINSYGNSFSPLMRIRISLFLLALLAGVTTARAEAISLFPGHSQSQPIVVGAELVLTLEGPGTYTAPSWTFLGELRLGAPGNYTVVASTGSIVFHRNSRIEGGRQVTAVPRRLTFAHAGDFTLGCNELDVTIEITQGPLPVVTAPPLVNLSTRVTLAAGQLHISGFVVGGRIMRAVLVRAVGPTLQSFGVTNPLATPVVTVFNNQTPLKTNSGWGGDPLVGDTATVVGAFPLPSDSRDAAMIVHLRPGSYTVQVGGGAGEVLLEIYYIE